MNLPNSNSDDIIVTILQVTLSNFISILYIFYLTNLYYVHNKENPNGKNMLEKRILFTAYELILKSLLKRDQRKCQVESCVSFAIKRKGKGR